MPAWIVVAIAFDFAVLRALLELLNNFQRLVQLRLNANDADQILHALLQVRMYRIGILVAFTFEGRKHVAREGFDLIIVYVQRSAHSLGVFGSVETGAPPEDQ